MACDISIKCVNDGDNKNPFCGKIGPGTKLPHIFCAGIGPLQLGVVFLK